MAKRKATGATKAVGKVYWNGVAVKQGKAHGSASTLTEKCVRSGGGREACEKAARAGLKGRRPARPGKPWPRKSTPAMRAARKDFAKAARSCKGGSRAKRNTCVSKKLG